MLIITCVKRSNSQWGQESFKVSVSDKFVFIHILYMRTSLSQQIVESQSWETSCQVFSLSSVSGALFLLNMLFNVFSKSGFFDAEVSASSVGDRNYYYSPPCKEIPATFKQLLDINKIYS